jgi:hypothetical protein
MLEKILEQLCKNICESLFRSYRKWRKSDEFLVSARTLITLLYLTWWPKYEPYQVEQYTKLTLEKSLKHLCENICESLLGSYRKWRKTRYFEGSKIRPSAFPVIEAKVWAPATFWWFHSSPLVPLPRFEWSKCPVSLKNEHLAALWKKDAFLPPYVKGYMS